MFLRRSTRKILKQLVRYRSLSNIGYFSLANCIIKVSAYYIGGTGCLYKWIVIRFQWWLWLKFKVKHTYILNSRFKINKTRQSQSSDVSNFCKSIIRLAKLCNLKHCTTIRGSVGRFGVWRGLTLLSQATRNPVYPYQRPNHAQQYNWADKISPYTLSLRADEMLQW